MITLDLHPIFRNDRDIDRAVRDAVFKAAHRPGEQVEIVHGKGSGKLRQRVLAILNQKHMKKLYKRIELDPHNTGRIIVHF